MIIKAILLTCMEILTCLKCIKSATKNPGLKSVRVRRPSSEEIKYKRACYELQKSKKCSLTKT